MILSYRIILVCFWLSVHLVGSGQSWTYGAKIGTNLSGIEVGFQQLNGSVFYSDSKMGILAGLYADHEFLDSRIGIGGEVLFSRSTAHLDIRTIIDPTTLILDQLRVPVYISYELSPRLIARGGPYIAIRLSSKQERNQQKYDLDLQAWDFGWHFGAGYDLTQRLCLNARLYGGLLNLALPEEEIGQGAEMVDRASLKVFQPNYLTEVSLKYHLGKGQNKQAKGRSNRSL